MAFLLTPLALSDLQDIWAYIAAENITAADSLEADFYHACHLLADNPALGITRPKWTSHPVRFWPVRRQYLIVYRPHTQPLEILRILHGARNVPTLTREL